MAVPMEAASRVEVGSAVAVREVGLVAAVRVVGWVAAAKAAAAESAARAVVERREMRTQQTGCPPLPHSCQCHCMRQRSTHQCSHSAS